MILKDFLFRRQIEGWSSIPKVDQRLHMDLAKRRYFDRKGSRATVLLSAFSFILLFCFFVVIPVAMQWSGFVVALGVGCAVLLCVAGAELLMSALILKDLQSICRQKT